MVAVSSLLHHFLLHFLLSVMILLFYLCWETGGSTFYGPFKGTISPASSVITRNLSNEYTFKDQKITYKVFNQIKIIMIDLSFPFVYMPFTASEWPISALYFLYSNKQYRFMVFRCNLSKQYSCRAGDPRPFHNLVRT